MKDMDKNKELFQTTDTGKEFSENLNELYKDDSSIKR
jgi:predicted transcriptional regulator